MPANFGEGARAAQDVKLAALQERLATAVEALVSSDDWVRAIEFAARFRSRSFGNTLLLRAQHAEAFEHGRVPEPFPTLVAGFQQWKELGRFVIKGQAGYMIQAPLTARFATTNPAEVESWRRLGKNERLRPGEVARSKMIGVKPAFVWDVSQTGGNPIPERPRPKLLAGDAPDGLWNGLAAQVRARGFRLEAAADARALDGANGVTNYINRTVTVRADMDDAAQVKTLAHEVAHIALGHEGRGVEGLHRGIREVEAESVAMMVTAAYGMDSAGYSIPYVGGWSSSVEGTDAVEVVRSTGELSRKAALLILEDLPEPSLGNGAPSGLDLRPQSDRRLSRSARQCYEADLRAQRVCPHESVSL
jgi:hypothetical protein